jgi:TonB family protein
MSSHALHSESVDTAVHDVNGEVKLHTDIDDHLNRLFAADKAEIPWFLSLYYNIRDVVKPEKLPPLVITSKPVAVKSIWGLYRKDPKSMYMSAAINITAVLLLYFVFSNATVQKALKQSVNLIDPNLKPFIPEKPKGGGGGGGAREVTPVSKGELPKPKMRQFVPPMITHIEHPLLPMDPSLIVPPDEKLPQLTAENWGDPLAKLGLPSNGTGFGLGMGSGSGGGVGSGKGGGFGPGEGGGVGGGVFRVGNGTSAPAVIFKVDPEYSEEARKAKYSGSVLLSIVVDTDGHASNVHVIKSLGMGLDEKAIEAVEKWKFKPGMRGGQPVRVMATIEVNFRLL